MVLCAVCVAVLLWAERLGSRPAIAVAKLGASSCFVWAALAWGGLDSSFGIGVLTGLVLCWLGDALLVPPGQGVAFQLGIGAFLLGHVAYAISFGGLGVDFVVLGVAGVALAVGAIRLMQWLGPDVPQDFKLPVRLYVFVISAMVGLAIAAVAAGHPLVIALGAVGFAASDISVARDRFVAPGFINGAWGLPLYFGSQCLMALSIPQVAAST